MNQQLAVSLQSEITKKHKEGVSLDSQLRKTLLAKLETTREVGILLDTAQHELDAAWDEFAARLPFDGNAIRQYLRFAARHPEPIVDIKAAFRFAIESAIATGLIEFPQGFGQPQKLHEPNFLSKLTLTIQALASDWRKFVSRRPLDKMPDESKELILHSLKPIFRIHREIMASLKHGN